MAAALKVAVLPDVTVWLSGLRVTFSGTDSTASNVLASSAYPVLFVCTFVPPEVHMLVQLQMIPTFRGSRRSIP